MEPYSADYEFYNENPTGRSVGDCAVRAVSIALGVDWETAYALMAVAGYNMGDMPSSNSVWGAVLRQHGFYRYNLPETCPNCYTFADFAQDHPQYMRSAQQPCRGTLRGIIYIPCRSRSEALPIFPPKNVRQMKIFVTKICIHEKFILSLHPIGYKMYYSL